MQLISKMSEEESLKSTGSQASRSSFFAEIPCMRESLMVSLGLASLSWFARQMGGARAPVRSFVLVFCGANLAYYPYCRHRLSQKQDFVMMLQRRKHEETLLQQIVSENIEIQEEISRIDLDDGDYDDGEEKQKGRGF